MADELGLFGEEPGFSEPAPAPVVETPPPAPEKPVEPAPVEAPKGEKVDAPPASGPARDPETGKFAKRDDEHSVPLSAMLSERDRRQAAEKALADFQAAAPKADIWADPDAYVKSKLAEFEPALLSKAELAAKETFFRYTENATIEKYRSDPVTYEKARDAFIQVAQRDPLMTAKLREAPNPGEFIYQQGKIAMQLAEVGGDLAAYRTKIETEARQKWETEAAARDKRNAGIPVSLNQEPSKGAGVVGGTWAGPTPVEELFPER